MRPPFLASRKFYSFMAINANNLDGRFKFPVKCSHFLVEEVR